MDYKRLYYSMFGDIADAIEALQQRDYGTAEKLLIEAQQAIEEEYLREAEAEYFMEDGEFATGEDAG